MSVVDRIRAALAGTIAEIEDARRAATAELISFKAGEKLMAARAGELAAEAEEWQRRAEDSLRRGDDDLARQALARRSEVTAELARVRAERDEQARIAADMLRGRRELDAKLAKLKLHEGTVAAGLAAARTAETSFATEGGAWDRFADAERRIEEDSILGELSESEIDGVAHDHAESHDPAHTGDALAELKRRMNEKS